MKVTVLSSSRADYSILYPLIKKLKSDSFFDLSIIAFGTHTSSFHGNTIDSFYNDGFDVNYSINSIVIGDTPDTINSSISLTIQKFSNIWETQKVDLIIALGDRFEMFAAISAALPYGIKVAHIHGGETTTGAIDNVYRHAISLMSHIHFVSTSEYGQRLEMLLNSNNNIYNVGALSVENILNLKLLTTKEFLEKYGIDLELPTILCTIHPETVSYELNKQHIIEILNAFKELEDYQVLITLPNIDTMGIHIREQILFYAKKYHNLIVTESLGTIGYLTAMKYCAFLIGNTSSGFVEASIFPKKVINLGMRQNGRIITNNITQCHFNKTDILSKINYIKNLPTPKNSNIYGDGSTSTKIINILKNGI